MALAVEMGAAARLDLGEVRRSRWLVFAGAVYAVLAGVFVVAGLHESAVAGFTGMGRVLFSLCHALVLLLPLLALAATCQAVNRARDDGTLELCFAQPLRREAWFGAVSLVRYGALFLPLALLMAALAAGGGVAFGQEIEWAFAARAVGVCAALLAAYTGVGLLISVAVRNQARAMMYALLVWAASVALLDFALVGLMLQWRLNARVVLLLAALNPVQAARLGLLGGSEPELAVLGPVGFFLSTRLGGGALAVLGSAWPALVGAGAWALAARLFRRGDLV